MNYLPIFLDLRDRLCLVVGGSETAARKAELLLRAGALGCCRTDLHEGFARLPHAERVTRVADAFTPGLLDGKDAVIVVEDDAAAAGVVADAARARHIPVNVADKPALCSLVGPSIIDRSPIMVAVSSGGESPVLARMLRARLETGSRGLRPSQRTGFALQGPRARSDQTGTAPRFLGKSVPVAGRRNGVFRTRRRGRGAA